MSFVRHYAFRASDLSPLKVRDDSQNVALYSNYNNNRAFQDNVEVSTLATGGTDPAATSITVSGNSASLVFKGMPGTDDYCAGSPDLTGWTPELVPTDTA